MTKLGRSRSSSKGSTTTSGTQPSSDTPRRRYETRTFWDQWYQKHGEAVEWSGPVSDTALHAITDVLKGLRKGEEEVLRVCELGCGCSHLAPMLRDFGVEVIGVDFSQEVISANKLRHPDIQWECCDALHLAERFAPGYFDAIVGKTLIDCFLTRTDAAGSIRRMLQQCRVVLKDNGCMMLLDKASSDSIIGRGRARQLTVDTHKTLTFRVLHPLPRQGYSAGLSAEESSPCQRQWELEIEPTLHKHFVVRPAAAGSGSLVVWSTDNVATSAGIETGDLILGYRRSGFKNMTVGSAVETAKAIRSSLKNLTLLLERPAAGAARRKTASLKTRLMSRQSTSQSDHLRRLQKARLLRAGDMMPGKDVTLPQLTVKADSFISDYTCAAEGYFL